MKEKITYTLLSLVVMIVVSCSHSEKSDENEREYYPRTTFTLEDSVRTLNLSYIMWACECPNRAITENLYKYQEN
jgi:hypothetical protein